MDYLTGMSAFANWLAAKRRASASTTRGHIGDPFKSTQDLPPVYEDALDFLHVVPKDVDDLPARRRSSGFDNLDFHYGGTAALAFGRKCIAERPLPDYPIVRIRTGQFTPDGDQIWRVEFPVGAVEGAPSPSAAVP